ncbi:MAG: hypothetical protein Kapaf2KO_03300 [Candidatus Kapaibacteriales bacterium]
MYSLNNLKRGDTIFFVIDSVSIDLVINDTIINSNRLFISKISNNYSFDFENNNDLLLLE